MLTNLKLAAVGSLLLAPLANAQTYFTVDVFNDVLCSVNVLTGVVTPMGPLQADLGSVDLAWHNTWAGGALYAKTYGTPAGNKVCQIVTNGDWVGLALQGAILNGEGYQGAEAAGLASDGTSLYLTYSNQSAPNNFSQSFGAITPIWAGTINPTAVALSSDIDAMGFAGGLFYGVDVINLANGYRVYSGNAATGPNTQLPGQNATTHPYNLATNPIDLEAFSTTELVSISQNGLNLLRVSRTTGIVTLVTPLTGQMAGGILSGIARRPNPCPRFVGFPVSPSSHP